MPGRRKAIATVTRSDHLTFSSLQPQPLSPEDDEHGDQDGADGVRDHQTEILHQDGGGDHPNAPQGVGQDVQKHT